MSKKHTFTHAEPRFGWRGIFLPFLALFLSLGGRAALAAPIDSNDIEVTQQVVTATYFGNNASNVVVNCAKFESHIANTKQILFVRYTASGTMADSTAITNVNLVKEGTSKNCVYDGDDTIVGTGTFSGDNGTVSFTLGTPIDVPGGAGSAQNLILMYTLNGTATANQTFSARVDTATSADLQVQHFGACCGPVDILGSFPINGAVQTVKGALTLAAGAQNPAAGVKKIGGTNQAMLQFTLTASSAENVTLQSLKLNPTGTATDNTHFTAVKVYRDTAAPFGEVSGSDPLVSTAATYGADNTITSFDINPDYTIIAGTTETFIVAYDISGAAPAGVTAITSITSGSIDVTAVGATTAQSVVPTGSLTSSTHILGAELTVAAGATNPAASYVRANSTSVLVQSMTLDESTGSEDVILNSITLTPTGTGPDTSSGITSVVMCFDVDQNGNCLGGGDFALATSPATFATDNTAQTFNFTGVPQISAGQTLDLLVYYNYAAGVTGGMTFRSALSQSSHLSVTGETSATALTLLGAGGASFPFQGGQTTVLGGITVADGDNQPAAGFGVYTAQTTAVTRQIKLTAGAEEAIDLEAIRLSPSGTGNDAAEIAVVRFYLDIGSTPGAVDGTDTLLTSSPTTFATNDTAQVFSFSATLPNIPINTSRHLLVVYEIAGGASPAGDTWSTGISASSDLFYKGSTSGISFTSTTAANNVAHTLSNAHPAKLTGRATITNVNTPGVSLPASVLSQSVLSFTVAADALENLVLNAFQLGNSSTGGGHTSNHVSEVALYEDLDSDNVVSAGDTLYLPVGAPLNYGGTTPLTYRLQSPQTITASGTRRFLVTYNMGVSPGANGSTYVASISPTYLELSGSTSTGNATISGSTLTSATHQVYGAITNVANQSLAAVSGSAVAVVNGAPTQAVQRLQITVSAAEQASLQSIKIRPNGTANDQSNITAVRFYLDVGTEAGRVDSGDTTLATTNTTFTADNTATTFNFTAPITLASGTTHNLLVAYDVAAGTSTAAGAFQGIMDRPSVDIVATGSNSGVRLIPQDGASAPNNSVQTGDSMSAIPGVTVSTGATNPAATGIIENAAFQVVMQMTLTNGTGSTNNVTRIALTPSGSMDDLAELTNVTLWLDADANGAFSSTLDTQLNTTFTAYTADSTYRNFILDTPVNLTSGQAKSVFVVYYLPAAPTADPGDTLAVTMPSGTSRLTPKVTWQETPITAALGDWGLGSATGNTHKVTGRVTITDGAEVSAAPTISASNPGVNMANFNVTPNGEDFSAVTFTLTPSGTGQDAFDISAVKACVDTASKSCNDDAANLCTLSANTYTTDNTARSFTITGGVGLCASTITQARNISVDYTMAGSASAGETFALALTSVTATGVSSSQAILTNSYTVTPATATVAGSVAVVSGSNNPTTSFAVWNDASMEIMQLAITPGPEENMLLKSILLDPTPASGAGGLATSDATEITAVKFYWDTNSNGLVDGGDTLLTTTPATFTANDTPTSFSFNAGTGVTVTAGITTNLLVAYTMAATAGSAGRDASGQITNLYDIYMTGALTSNQYVATGLQPMRSSVKSVVGSATLALGAQTPGAQSVGTNISASYLQFSIAADTFQTVSLKSVNITPAGTGNDATGLLSPSLYLDNDNSGTLNTGDCLIKQVTTGYSADNTATLFDLSTDPDTCRQITAGTTKNFIVVVETSPTATAGQTFNAKIAALTDVVLSSSTVTSLNPTGTVPVSGNDLVLNGTLNVTTATSPPAAAGVEADALGVPVFGFKLSALTENTRVDRIDLRDVGVGAGGSLNDNTGITQVKFYVDEGSTPGAVDGTDTLLTITPTNFLADVTDAVEQQFTIVGGVTINSGQSKNILVAVDFNGNISPSKTLQYQINSPAADVVATGLSTSTTITPSGTQVAANIQTIKGKMFLALSPNTPPAQGIRANSNDQPIMALSLQAGEEDLVLQEIRVKPTGSGNDNTGITGIKFYFDTGTAGIVDGETQIVTASAAVYPADETAIAITLGGAAGARTITAGTTKTLLVTYDMGTPIAPGSTFRAQLTQSTDIRATGGSSLQTIYANTTAAGNIQTVAGNLAVENANLFGNGAIVPGQTNQPAASFKFSVDSAENITLNTLQVTPSGTGNDATNITAVKFWVDNDASGTVSAGDTQIDASPLVYTADNTATTFTFTSGLSLPASGFKNVLVTYDLSAGTIGGNSFVATVPALGATGLGGTSAVNIRSTVAAAGPTRIATGTFMASLSPNTPATGGVDLSDSEAEVLAVDFTAGPNSGIYLNYLTLTPAGTVNDFTSLAAVKFYWDLNTPGIVDGEAALNATPVSFSANDTATQFDFASQNASASILVAAGQSRRLLVVYDFVDGTAAGLTARASIASATDVSASEQVSFLSVSPTLGGSITGNYQTTRNGATVAAGVFNPISSNIRGSSLNVPMLQFTVTNGPNESSNLYGLTLTPTGTADDRLDVTQLKLYRDSGATQGEVDGTDVAITLATNKYSSDETATTFLIAGTETITANTAQNYLLVYDMANTASTGETLRADLSGSNAVQLRGVTSNQVFGVGGGNVNGNTQTIRGGLTFQAGLNNPPARAHNNAEDKTPTTQLRMTADASAGIRVESLALTPASPAGCAATQFDDSADILQVRFFDDADGDAVADVGETELGATPATYTVDGTLQIFTLAAPFDITAGTTKNLLAAYTLGGTAAACEVFSASAVLSSSVVAKDITGGLSAAIVSGSVSGNTQTIGGVVTLAKGPASPLSTVGVRKNQQDAPVLQFTLLADSAEAVQLENLTLTPAGTANDVSDLTTSVAADVSLYYDIDADGVLDAGEWQVATTPTGYTTNDTARQFTLTTAFVISASQTAAFLVTYNIGSTPVTGATFQASISLSSQVQVRGVSSSSLINATGSAVGNVLTVTGPLTAALGGSNPAARAINPTATGVPVLQFTLTPGADENVKLQAVALTPNGSGQDNTDIDKVHIYLDVNADAKVDAGDTEVALTGSTIFSANNTKTAFNLAAPLELAASTTGTFLVTVDMDSAGGAITGETFAIGISQGADISMSGVVSLQAIPVTLAPTTGLVGNPIQIGGDLSAAMGPGNPAAVGVAPGAMAQPILQMVVTAGTSEGVDITAIALTPAGSADERSQNTVVDGRVAKVRFFVDANQNGAADTGEEEIIPNLTPSVFGSDTVKQVFTLPAGGGRRVTAGQSKTFLVAYDLTAYTNSANVNPLQETLKVTLDPATDLTAQGATSGSPITAMGAILSSSTMTFAGSLAGAVDAATPAAANVATGVTDQPVFRFNLQALSETVTLKTVTVTGAGTLNEDTAISSLKLYRDNGATVGSVDSTDTLVASSGGSPFTTNNGTATLTLISGGLAMTVNATPVTGSFSTSESFLLTASLSGTETAGQTMAFTLVGANAATGTGGLTSQTIRLPNTTSLSSNNLTVVGALTVGIGPKTPASTIARAQAAAPVLQFTVRTGAAEDVRLDTVTLTPSGTGNDATDVDAVKFYADANDNGLADTGDTLLTTTPAQFTANDTATAFTITGGYTLTKGTNKNILVAYQTNNNPAAGASFKASLASNTQLTGTGVTSGAPASISLSGGAAVNGNTLFIDTTSPALVTTNPAFASDGTAKLDALDDDDTVRFTFTEPMRAVTVDATNVNLVLGLNNSHSWLSGGTNGQITSANWTATTTLEIKLKSNATQPATVAIGDTVTLSAGFFVDAAGNTLTGTTTTITGNFDEKAPALLTPAPAGVTLNSLGEIDAKFSELLDTVSSQVAANYTIAAKSGSTDTLTVTSATLQADGKTVRVRFGGMTAAANAVYTLTVKNVKDRATDTANAIPVSGITQDFNQVTTGLYTKLVVVPPGMTFSATALTPSAPTGLPTQPRVGVAYAVKLYATDDNFRLVAGITNPVRVLITPTTVLDANTNPVAVNMSGGEATVNLLFDAAGSFSMSAADSNNTQAVVVAPDASKFTAGATGNISNSTKLFQTLQLSEAGGLVQQLITVGTSNITVLQHDDTDPNTAPTQVPANGQTASNVVITLVDDSGVPIQNNDVRLLINDQAPTGREASAAGEGSPRQASAAPVSLPSPSGAVFSSGTDGKVTFALTSQQAGTFKVQAQAKNANGTYTNVGGSFSLVYRAVNAVGNQDTLNQTVSGDVFNVNGTLQIVSRIGDPTGIDTTGAGTFVLTHNGAVVGSTVSCTPAGTLASPVQVETLCVFTLATPAGGWPVGSNTFQLTYVDVNGASGSGIGARASASPQTFVLTGTSGFRLSNIMNVPNPFNPTDTSLNTNTCSMTGTNSASLRCTDLTFQASEDISSVSVTIYNSLGRPVKSIRYSDTTGISGVGFNNAVQWDGTDNGGSLVARGIYFYELRAVSQTGAVSSAKGKIAIVR